MRGTNNLHKNIFLALLKIAQKFQYFCKVRACRISVKNSILQKFDRRGPYKNNEIFVLSSIVLRKYFFANYLFHSSKEEFLHKFRQFL